MSQDQTELTVRSESVQSLYSRYLGDRFSVNRRYQRKLVWSVAEKQNLIDSLLKDLPIPLFLVAESGSGTDSALEVIDGMQRLNAIFSFLENEFPVDGEFFDLDALADTKLKKDSGDLTQLTPVMDRRKSAALANYDVALSVFRAKDSSSVDEVFRRINSGGRQLSSQELRQAGTLSTLADLVRVLSSQVRGDTSPGDIVPLKKMPQLSITSRDLNYGVDVDEIFWVKNGVLRREDVRTSQDEQLILDILIDCVIDPMPSIGKEARDAYYDFKVGGSGDAPKAIQLAISVYGADELRRDFMSVYDVFREAFAGSRFASVIGLASGGRAPRYFHAVFIALFELIIKQRLRPKSPAEIVTRLRGSSKGPLNIPGGSGNWTSESKRPTVDAVKGLLFSGFEPIPPGERDAMLHSGASEFETLLANSLVEQQMFECKQGLHRLDANRRFDSELLTRILETASAMANTGRGEPGYIAIGVVDTRRDADRVREIDGVDCISYRDFLIAGIEREAKLSGGDLNSYWTKIVQMIRDDGRLDAKLSSSITRDSRLVPYRSLAVGLIKIAPVDEPVFFDGKLFERSGSTTQEVPQAEYSRLFRAFVRPGSSG